MSLTAAAACRSFTGTLWRTVPLVLAVLSSALMLIIIIYYAIYYAPLQPIFHTEAIGSREWKWIIAASILPFLLAAGIDALRRLSQAVRK